MRSWIAVSMRRSLAVSSSVRLVTGMPVHTATTSAISVSVTSTRRRDSGLRHSSSIARFSEMIVFSLSRSEAAFSNSWASMAASFS